MSIASLVFSLIGVSLGAFGVFLLLSDPSSLVLIILFLTFCISSMAFTFSCVGLGVRRHKGCGIAGFVISLVVNTLMILLFIYLTMVLFGVGSELLVSLGLL